MEPTHQRHETANPELIERFLNHLNIIISTNLTEFYFDLSRRYPEPRDRSTVLYVKAAWITLVEKAEILLGLSDYVNLVPNYVEIIDSFTEKFDNLLRLSEITLQEIFNLSSSCSFYLISFMSDLQNNSIAAGIRLVPQRSDFFNNAVTDPNILNSLTSYENTAEIIRKDPGYESSRLRQLEKLLFDRRSYFDNNALYSNNIENLNFSGSFVALAAPSLEGKTQSAFVLREVRPLYFPLSTVSAQSSDTKNQFIYENYEALTLELCRYANEDLANIKRLRNNHDISASSIRRDLNMFKSRVLGFILALIEDANRPQVLQNSSWMRYHATRQNFSFNSARIHDIQADANIFKGFVLFLDEFVAEEWAIYVRNLARVIGLTCLVANTNTRIANLAGTETCSGGSVLDVWSIVIISLSSASLYLLNQLYSLRRNIDEIKRNSRDRGLIMFLNNFLINEIDNMRPGMSLFIAESIADFTANRSDLPTTLRLFLDTILKKVTVKLKIRKFRSNFNLLTQCAKIGLLLPESYERSPPSCEDFSWFFQGSSFLQNHLYRLVNPTGIDHWIFLTSPPDLNSKTLRFVSNNESSPWTTERTCFDEKEKSTILACLFLKFGNPVTDILTRAKNRSIQSAHDAQNVNAQQLQGNHLEVSAAVSVIDASQHCYGTVVNEEIFSLAGQKGINFIKNLIINLISEFEFVKISRTFEIAVERCSFNLMNAFRDMKMPFLYSLGREDKFFEKLDRLSESVYMKKYERTGNNMQIDGKFEFEYSGIKKLAVVECKNRAASISTSILNEVIERCSNLQNSKLFLVFCNKIIDSPRKISKFVKSCDIKLINVYRIVKSSRIRVFEIVPFYESSENPNFICILLESRTINTVIG